MSKDRETVIVVGQAAGDGASVRQALGDAYDVQGGKSAVAALDAVRDEGPRMLVFDPDGARELLELRSATIAAQFEIARLAESRDEDTGRHLERTREYCRLIATEYARQGGAADAAFAGMIYDVSPLHDIGKIAIPDGVLCKPGKLTDHEFEVMKSHTVRGAETIEQVVSRFPDNAFYRMARDVVRSHHEKWDGTGYPDGLSRDTIPLAARVMAIADVYDALTSKRPYKEPFPHDRSREIIREGGGTHFDPGLVKAFLAIEDRIEGVREMFVDDDSTHESRRWERAPQ